MRALVTGGFGLIGSALVPLLRASGWDVGVIARRVPSCLTELAADLDVYQHDLTHSAPPRLTRRYDLCIHLAGSPHSEERSDRAAAASNAVTRACVKLCRAEGIGRLLHFSTFQVYGRDHGVIDECSPAEPVNEYGKAHLQNEIQVREAGRDGILDVVVLRPTNVYGTPVHPEVQRWSLVPACFCRSAVEDREIVLRTSGRQEKDFIHLGRVAELTEAIARRFDRFRGQTINLASGRSRSIVDVAGEVKDRYEAMTGQACTLRILSSEPPAQAPLAVRSRHEVELPAHAGEEPSLSEEIERTLAGLAT